MKLRKGEHEMLFAFGVGMGAAINIMQLDHHQWQFWVLSFCSGFLFMRWLDRQYKKAGK